jgi:hypothetical protein
LSWAEEALQQVGVEFNQLQLHCEAMELQGEATRERYQLELQSVRGDLQQYIDTLQAQVFIYPVVHLQEKREEARERNGKEIAEIGS